MDCPRVDPHPQGERGAELLQTQNGNGVMKHFTNTGDDDPVFHIK